MDQPLPFFVMNTVQAARFRENNTGRMHGLDPVLVRGGPYAGQYALPRRVRNDPNHADQYAVLDMLPEVQLDPAVAFPPIVDDE